MNIFDPQSKVLANHDYVRQLLERGHAPPVLVEVDPSNVCNHGCEFCLSSYVHAGKQMLSESALIRLCDDLIACKVKAINWTGGGEPTTNPHLKRAIERVGTTSSVRMGMFTNGTLLGRFDLFDTIVKHLAWIRFSIDAGTPDTYNRIRRTRPGQDWAKMAVNLSRMIDVNNAAGKPMDIGVGFVVTPGNISDVLDFALMFKDIDVTYCQFKPEIVNIEREEGLQRNLSFWKMASRVLKDAQAILGSKFQINAYKLEDLSEDTQNYGRTYKKCLGSQISPCIGADGEVYVCTNLRGHKEYSYGSIHDRSFTEIWNDTVARDSVMDRIENKEKFGFCTKLCKPHESNKMLWELHCGYQAAADKGAFLADLERRGTAVNVKHPEFI